MSLSITLVWGSCSGLVYIGKSDVTLPLCDSAYIAIPVTCGRWAVMLPLCVSSVMSADACHRVISHDMLPLSVSACRLVNVPVRLSLPLWVVSLASPSML